MPIEPETGDLGRGKQRVRADLISKLSYKTSVLKANNCLVDDLTQKLLRNRSQGEVLLSSLCRYRANAEHSS